MQMATMISLIHQLQRCSSAAECAVCCRQLVMQTLQRSCRDIKVGYGECRVDRHITWSTGTLELLGALALGVVSRVVEPAWSWQVAPSGTPVQPGLLCLAFKTPAPWQAGVSEGCSSVHERL